MLREVAVLVKSRDAGARCALPGIAEPGSLNCGDDTCLIDSRGPDPGRARNYPGGWTKLCTITNPWPVPRELPPRLRSYGSRARDVRSLQLS